MIGDASLDLPRVYHVPVRHKSVWNRFVLKGVRQDSLTCVPAGMMCCADAYALKKTVLLILLSIACHYRLIH